jgi:protein involved in polysaccharide export with SLBB domain
MRAVQVRRNTQLVTSFDLYDYLLRGDTRSDVRLETGDVIFVPIHGTRVQVTGAVRRPAIYELKAGEALTDVIGAAGGFRPDAQLDRLTVYRLLAHRERGPGAPPRAALDLSLTHQGAPPGGPADGVTIPELTLQDGDSVVVNTVRSLEDQYYVALAGRVQQPGMYPWHAGMTLRDLVLLGRGPTVGAYLKEAEIARLPDDRSNGQLARTIRVPLDSTYLVNRDAAGQYFGPPGIGVAASGAPEVPLLPYDNVLILREPDFELQRTVHIAGEVRFPGTYALTSKAERLADLVTRSGGLTSEAYPEGVRFTRALSDVGRINVDVPGALRDPGSGLNIVLQPGDSLLIPEYEPSVKVAGAVNSPGSVLWKKGQDLEYYLSAAGGFSYKADKGRVNVKYANGEVRTRRRSVFFANNPKPGPGSEVFVPVRDTTAKTDWVTLVGAVAQILASVVTIAVVATKL